MLESARLREHNLAKARMAAAGAAQGRKEVKREAVQARVDATVQHTDRKLAELHKVIDEHDPRTDVFLALRAAGRSIAQATAEVEAHFAAEPINQGEPDADVDSGPE